MIFRAIRADSVKPLATALKRGSGTLSVKKSTLSRIEVFWVYYRMRRQFLPLSTPPRSPHGLSTATWSYALPTSSLRHATTGYTPFTHARVSQMLENRTSASVTPRTSPGSRYAIPTASCLRLSWVPFHIHPVIGLPPAASRLKSLALRHSLCYATLSTKIGIASSVAPPSGIVILH